MTLAPSRLLGPRLVLIQDDDVLVQEELATWCYVPSCKRTPEPGSHHIEPRSRTGGPRSFVVVDGLVVPNTCRLCSVHHLAVTGGIGGHTARIVWHAEPLGHWCWLEQVLDRGGKIPGQHPAWAVLGPLRFPHTLEVCNGSPAL